MKMAAKHVLGLLALGAGTFAMVGSPPAFADYQETAACVAACEVDNDECEDDADTAFAHCLSQGVPANTCAQWWSFLMSGCASNRSICIQYCYGAPEDPPEGGGESPFPQEIQEDPPEGGCEG